MTKTYFSTVENLALVIFKFKAILVSFPVYTATPVRGKEDACFSMEGRDKTGVGMKEILVDNVHTYKCVSLSSSLLEAFKKLIWFLNVFNFLAEIFHNMGQKGQQTRRKVMETVTYKGKNGNAVFFSADEGGKQTQ